MITIIDTFSFLLLDKYGLRKLELFFGVLIATMAFTFGYEVSTTTSLSEHPLKPIPSPSSTSCQRHRRARC